MHLQGSMVSAVCVRDRLIVCCCFVCGFVLLLEVFRVRFARLSCPRLRFVTYNVNLFPVLD